jgi:hypothetical protein
MTDNVNNFVKWFKEPLAGLYKNTDAGFIILMASLPLLERYLRQKSGVHESPKLTDDFYREFMVLFPSMGNIDDAKKVWNLFRHGLLHQGTIKTRTGKGDTILSVGVHNNANEIEISGYSSAGLTVRVSPNKFSEKVIASIERDFSTFESSDSPNHRLSTIDPNTGVSGCGKK